MFRLGERFTEMKLIHTSDWHLGARLHNWDETDEEEHLFVQLAEVVEDEQPDALVVSGDIFDTGTPGNDVAKRFTDALLEVTSRCPDMATVVIAGNHDSYSRLIVDKELWLRSWVHVFGMPSEDATGKAVFERNVVTLPGKGVIAAAPFCHPRNFPAVDGTAGDNREKDYFKGLAQHVADHSGGLPTVLMAHLAVRADIDLRGHDKSLIIGGEECVGVEELGDGYDYVALGHIHCPQEVKGKGGRTVVRYCGAPRAIHFDETYDHGVDVVTVAAGSSRTVEIRKKVFEPLHALVTIGGEDGLPFEDALRQLVEAQLPADTYIRLNVRLGADELPGPDWTERARQTCAANGVRFCLNNPVRAEAPEKPENRKILTMAELKELSDDEVLQILSARHKMTDRQLELVKSLMEKIQA